MAAKEAGASCCSCRGRVGLRVHDASARGKVDGMAAGPRPRRSCGSVAVPRAGRGGGCHGIRNRSMYLIRTGLASCRPDASARGAGILAGADALRHGSGPKAEPVRGLTHSGPAGGSAGGAANAGARCRWRGCRGGPLPLLCGHRGGRPAEWPSAGRAGAGRRIQKRPGKAPAFNRISRAD